MESKLIRLIFSEKILSEEPPVLVDIGGAGGMHKVFKKIEEFACIVCIDGDSRDFSIKNKKNIIPITAIISESKNENSDFFLTINPHCSSTLEPLNSRLEKYAFSTLFEVVKKINVKSTTLVEVLINNNLTIVDWFKADTQGTDLRLFRSLPEAIREKVIVAEFEPGIIDAYMGEDKFFDVLAYMNDKNFWVDEAVIKGSKRMNLKYLGENIPKEKLGKFESLNKDSPGWCEVSFINNFENPNMKTKRNLLLGILFSVLKKQFGFALQLAYEGNDLFGDKIFIDSIAIIEKMYAVELSERNKKRWLNRIERIFRKIIP